MPLPTLLAPAIPAIIDSLLGGGTIYITIGSFYAIQADTQWAANKDTMLAAEASRRGVAVSTLTQSDIANVYDTFRHAYTSGLMTTTYGANVARVFDLNEINSTGAPKNRDLWNNHEMRVDAVGLTPNDLIPLIASKIQSGDFIMTDDPGVDGRVYSGSIMSDAEVLALDPIMLDQLWESKTIEEISSDIENFLLNTPDSTIESLPQWMQDVIDKFSEGEEVASPLVLDLDGNGIELSNLNSGDAVYWSHKLNGFANASGWTSGGDGLLAYDTNEDGVINNSTELFGNTGSYSNGFSALQVHDSNGDGLINAGDVAYSKLLVWVDSNQNGYSEKIELHTLSSLSITSINLAYSNVDYTVQGNKILQESNFVIGGQTRTISDVYFAIDNANTVYTGAQNLDFRTAVLPALKGTGSLADTYWVASVDNTASGNLFTKLVNLNALTFSQIFDGTSNLTNDVRAILYRWAGVDSVSSNSRGPSVDAKELGFLEKLTGTPFLQLGISENPMGPYAGNAIKEAFTLAFNNLYARLVTQAAGGELFTGTVVYDIASDSFSGITGINTTKLSSLQSEATGLANTATKQSFWENVVRMVEFSVGVNNLPVASRTALQNAITASDSTLDLQDDILPALNYIAPVGSTVTGTAAGETLSGTSGDDTINAAAGNDTLNGLSGNDTLNGGNDIDILNGGLNNDVLQGGTGSDIYNYNIGDGADTIIETGTDTGNKIVFGAGITLSDLTIQKMGSTSLLILVNETTPGQIVVQNQFSTSGSSFISLLQFSDASTYTLTDKNFSSYGTSQNDTITGTSANGLTNDTIYGLDGNDIINSGVGNDTIYGGAGYENIDAGTGDDIVYGDAGNDIITGYDGNDTIYGGADNDTLTGAIGNDTLYGDAGNDLLKGGAGNDIYVYSSGTDIIDDGSSSSSTADELRMTSGIVAANLTYSRINNSDLKIDVAGQGSITIKNQFGSSSQAFWIETLRFADNSTVNLRTKTYTTYGTSGVDTLNGIPASSGGSTADIIYLYDGDDTSDAGVGNDTVYGGNGVDTISGNDGDDILYGDYGNDIINGGAGVDNLHGGVGNDTLRGNAGSDIYHYTGGIDVIDDLSSSLGTADEIRLASGIVAANLTYTRINSLDLKIDVAGYGSITILNQFGSSSQGYFIETVRFSNNSTVNLKTQAYITEGTSGNDTLNGIPNSSGGSNVDTIYLRDGNDTSSAGDGNDTVYGGNGIDTLYGDAGNDILYGEVGNDIIQGGAGDDLIYGGAGADSLTGGTNKDTFRFDVASLGSSDTITDFSKTQADVLHIKDILVGYDPVTKAITDYISFATSGSNTIVSVDRDGLSGTYASQAIATLNAVTTFDANAMVANGTLIAS